MKFLASVVFILPIWLSAQSLLGGKIVDYQGEPVIGATVVIKNSKVGVVTDIEGKFSFGKMLHEDYVLNISSVGYLPLEVEVNHRSSKNHVFSIQEDIKELEGVVVHSDTESARITTSGFSVKVIGLDALKDLNVDINYALRGVSGINVRERGGLGAGFDLSLNGLSGKQVRYFMDEMPMEFFGSSLTLNNFPANLVKSIEVFKGVVPVRLASDALGGAIHVKTPDADSHFADVSYSFGSFNTHRASFFFQNNLGNQLHLRLMSFFNHSDNNYWMNGVPVSDRLGNILGSERVRRFHDQYTSGLISARVGTSSGKLADEFAMGVTYSANENEIQHTDVSINRTFGDLTSNSQTFYGSLHYEKEIGKLEVKGDAIVGQAKTTYRDTLMERYNWLGESWELDRAEGDGGPSIFHLDDAFKWMRGSVIYKMYENHLLVSQFTLNHLDRLGSDELSQRQTIFSLPNFLYKKTLGISYDYQSPNEQFKSSVFGKQYWYQAESFSEEFVDNIEQIVKNHSSFSNTGLGVALSYKPFGRWLLKGSYERAYRLPETFEVLGDGLQVNPNPDLDPENAHNANLGLTFVKEGVKSGFKSELDLFYRPVKDKIVRVAQGILSTHQNVKRARILGAAYSNSYRVGRYTLRLNCTYQHVTDQSPYNEGLINDSYGERLPNIPYLFGDLNLQYKLPLQKVVMTASWATHYVHSFFLYSVLYGDPGSRRTIPSQFVNDIDFNCSFGQGKYSASMSVRNLFDTEAYDNWSIQKPGRAFHLKLRYYLNFN